ncbi:MAG: porin [Rhodovarius sp.]|nr:porin [Rhodovarius sp.]
MRKILLGTTAVVAVGFASAAITPAEAQTAPTVRIGGSIAAYWGYAQQRGRDITTLPTAITGLPTTAIGQALNLERPTAPFVPPGNTTQGSSAAYMSPHDFVVLPAINFNIDGKLANGLAYGGAILLNMNSMEGRNIVQRRASAPRTTVSIDEAWVYIRHPSFGEVRFGDEDGPMGGLMNSGWITGFGTGGVFGAWEQVATRAAQNRTMTAPAGLGDNSKIVYLSPQFFGFDFGLSFSPNLGEGGSTGCPNDVASGWCDSSWAFRGASAAGITAAGGFLGARRNEYQVALRYRGNFEGVGIAATVGYIGSGAARDILNGGATIKTMRGLSVFQVGAQASYAGFTVGANYSTGAFNWFWGNTRVGDRDAQQFSAGITYTAGPITIGGNMVTGLFEGGSRMSVVNGATGATAPLPFGAAGSAMQRRWGWGIGGNYRLAPGLDLIAEYAYHSIREPFVTPAVGSTTNAAGVVQLGGVPGQRASSSVFLLGTRLAF